MSYNKQTKQNSKIVGLTAEKAYKGYFYRFNIIVPTNKFNIQQF